ncbi:MAG: TIGR00282 family metallophosphoesterase [Syntrophomonadaceae bacterium]|nr:TIGR00282 family metallophosphoesterase [Syntrophomonadaceae bacterium]
MNILMIGDIVGRPGRRAVSTLLPGIVKKENIEFVIANGENAAGGRGINREITEDFLRMGIEVITMGNHVWDNREIYEFIDKQPRIVRPANYPDDCPGRGYNIFLGPKGRRIAVINVSGRVFMASLECPFRTIDYILHQIDGQADIILVDIHAEATSEKEALAWYLDGRVTGVFGTHTHVQTADETILPGCTAYITDVGMTGPRNSVLGVKTHQVIERFLTQRPGHFETASGIAQLDGVVLEVDDNTLRAISLHRIKQLVEA